VYGLSGNLAMPPFLSIDSSQTLPASLIKILSKQQPIISSHFGIVTGGSAYSN